MIFINHTALCKEASGKPPNIESDSRNFIYLFWLSIRREEKGRISLLSSQQKIRSPTDFKYMRRAIGFGITILVLKFLMSEVFEAFEATAVNLFDTANVFLGQAELLPSGVDVTSLIPR